MSQQDEKETAIRLIELSFDNPEQLKFVLSETNIIPESILLRQRAAKIISNAKNKDEAIVLLKEEL